MDQPLELAPHTCLDVLPGRDRSAGHSSFVRCYHDDDPLQNTPADRSNCAASRSSGGLAACSPTVSGIWDATASRPAHVGTRRLFPAEQRHEDYRRWLWMLEPNRATPAQLRSGPRPTDTASKRWPRWPTSRAFHARRTRDSRDSDSREPAPSVSWRQWILGRRSGIPARTQQRAERVARRADQRSAMASGACGSQRSSAGVRLVAIIHPLGSAMSSGRSNTHVAVRRCVPSQCDGVFAGSENAV